MTSPTNAASPALIQQSVVISHSRFWLGATAVMLALTIIGFAPFYLRGNGLGERMISPQLLPLVVVHGAALTAWMVLLVIQPTLINMRSVRAHMKIGTWSLAIAVISAASGIMLAYASIRDDPGFPFWGRPYWQFGPSMFTEMLVFSGFVAAGYLNRKRPHRHRALMLLAGISVLAGATVRIPAIVPLFGDSGWLGVFGPAVGFGVLLAAIRFAQDRQIDWWLTAGLALMAWTYAAAWWAGDTAAWAAIVERSVGSAIS